MAIVTLPNKSNRVRLDSFLTENNITLTLKQDTDGFWTASCTPNLIGGKGFHFNTSVAGRHFIGTRTACEFAAAFFSRACLRDLDLAMSPARVVQEIDNTKVEVVV